MRNFTIQGALLWGAVGLHLVVRLHGAAPLAPGEIPTPAAPPETRPPVRSIELPHFEPDLAMAPGRSEFMVVCVGCHSPRYVMMQPYFAQRQWEETVDKMAKNYGAQMDAGQRNAIVAYLVATHGPNSAAEASAPPDDDSPALSPAELPPPQDEAPLLRSSADASARGAGVKRGETLFLQDCAGCHGVGGRGDGVVAKVLLRKPKNLTANRFSMRLLSQVLWNGKRGTAMPSWRSLPQTDLADLAAYVQSLHPLAQPDAAAPEMIAQGGKTFLLNCAPCHGEAGDGQGLAAASLLPEPANFRLKQPDSAYLQQVLSDGIPGTAMPSWKDQIAEPGRQALAAYVRSLFAAGSDQ